MKKSQNKQVIEMNIRAITYSQPPIKTRRSRPTGLFVSFFTYKTPFSIYAEKGATWNKKKIRALK
ncbi:hypothetical protein DN757_11955 [Paenibacillus silvae]|uniref:Uncharacterized protein n=1 Tax=Paenibacillus silvae TaxID=1325358 RepID=A0A2W6NI99_9BACL|nr:hypothetical protein DN757_11955 [Paenibacillus silvae]